MKYALLLLFCLTFPACLTARLPVTYVPPEEAAWFKLPYEFPKEGQQTISGTMAAAIQLAMDDFRPRHIPPPGDATPREICLHQRQVYDIEAAPTGEQIMLVRITVSPGACKLGRALSHDMGATYAVDTRNWRIRSSSPPASPRSAPSPIPHAPPEEAAQVVFPLALPEQDASAWRATRRQQSSSPSRTSSPRALLLLPSPTGRPAWIGANPMT